MPRFKSNARLVSLQNGIAEEALAQVVGPDRTIGCVVNWGATQVGAGSLEETSPGEFVIGNWDEGNGPGRLAPIQAMLEAVQPTRTTTNIIGHLYAKLIIHGVRVPANDAVVTMVHQIQDGSRSIGMANLDDPAVSGR